MKKIKFRHKGTLLYLLILYGKFKLLFLFLNIPKDDGEFILSQGHRGCTIYCKHYLGKSFLCVFVWFLIVLVNN